MSDEFGLNKATIDTNSTAVKLVADLAKAKAGEEVVITCDTESDWELAQAVEKATSSIGAKPVLVRTKAPPHVGRAAEPYLPVSALTSVVANSDIWIEFNGKWLLYSTIYEEAMRRKRTRYLCLVGMTRDMADRCIGRVDVPTLLEFQRELQKITERSRQMRYTTPGGTDVTFENSRDRPVLVEGDVSGPGEYMLLGQVDWAPIEETINGIIVFDGSVNPPDELGLLSSDHQIRLEVKEGRVVGFGGDRGPVYERWIKSLNDENMYRLAHLSYGCNPGAILTGNVLEDERVWGVLEWGLGNQSEGFRAKNIRAMSHSDGITLKPTLWADGEPILKDGVYVHKDLADLASKISASKMA
jgi:2,5-dihydroxypyridine 5,6-dioxygenase